MHERLFVHWSADGEHHTDLLGAVRAGALDVGGQPIAGLDALTPDPRVSSAGSSTPAVETTNGFATAPPPGRIAERARPRSLSADPNVDVAPVD